MDDVVIRCESIGKQYRIGERESYKALRDVLADALYAPFRRLRSISQDSQGQRRPDDRAMIWALKDVSFEIRRGEVVGVIGRNGAGKTTLLRILSRITEPTRGYAHICGRVGSLLEVGTGFHPELTGRENIFLNGAILGMRKSEILRKFDEIVAFSEVEKFIDTPVKHYSSGMYMRLAFAVAAHLESEILLVDEVLAVGDVEFQRKCLGRMGQVAQGGRTILFVSHNLGAVSSICNRSMWVDGGQMVFAGPSKEVVKRYQASHAGTESEWRRLPAEKSPSAVMLQRVSVLGSDGAPNGRFACEEAVTLEIEYVLQQTIQGCHVAATLSNAAGIAILTTTDWDLSDHTPFIKAAGSYVARVTIPANLLSPGMYFVTVCAQLPYRHVHDMLQHAVAFEVMDSGMFRYERPGVVAPLIQWRTSSRRKYDE